MSGWQVEGIPGGITVQGSYYLSGTGGGTQWTEATPSTPGYFLYYDDGVNPPELFFALTAAPGSDQWGNTWPGGMLFTGLPQAPNILSVEDTSGNVLSTLDSSGNITGQTIQAATDVLIAGESVSGDLAALPQGFVNYGFMPVGGTAWPSTAIGATEVPLWELDQDTQPNRIYEFIMNPTIINAVGGALSAHLRLRYTNDGSTPTTASTIATTCASRVETAGTDAAIGPLRCPFFTGASPATYRFLVTANCGANSFQFKNDNFVRIAVYDQGFNDNANFNNLIVLGTGSGGGPSPQTYTETFYPTHTWCYYSNFGLRNQDGSMYQGAYSGEAPAYMYSYIQWANGSRGNSLSTVLNYPNVNWVKLRLTNQHSWYNSGMTVSLHNSPTLGGGSGVVSTETQNWTTGEGSTKTVNLTPSSWVAFKTAGNYMVLYPPGGTSNLQYYGYFAGGGSGSGSKPMLQVNYTH